MFLHEAPHLPRQPRWGLAPIRTAFTRLLGEGIHTRVALGAMHQDLKVDAWDPVPYVCSKGSPGM